MTVHRWQSIRRRPVPTWRDLSSRFADDRSCLAAFLALEGAEVLEGDKPANLVNIVNRAQPCGRNLYRLWRLYGEEMTGLCGLRADVLADRGESLLLMLWNPERLEELLQRAPVRGMLRRLGYPEDVASNSLPDILRTRLANGGFPHEVGIFLGYPLKDVAGFLGWTRLPFSCQGPWKIFGDPGSSLALAARFRRHRQSVANRLARSDTSLFSAGTPTGW